jgi:hypothetical protein
MFVSRLRPVVLAALLLGGGALAAPALAQTATVRTEENLRAAPNDAILGVLSPGAELGVVGRQGGWVEVELEGWVWIRSLQITDRDGYDLIVVPEEAGAERENLRTRPAGPVVVSLVRGSLLAEVERIPGWVRVRRRAWVWARSVDVDESGPGSDAAAAPPRSQETPGMGMVRAPRPGTAILGAPDGDTLAHAASGADLAVLARRGNWARVRLEGWAWMPDTIAGDDDREPPTGDASPGAVVGDPLAWRGRVVTWTLQFISLERAEAVRTDFYEGEPFLLARTLDDAVAPFVYVALPPDRVAEGEGLTPLERITVVGRVRVGASALTGSPIVDLMELRRGGRR